MIVEQVLATKKRTVPTLGPGAGVADAAQLLAREEVGIVVVCDDGRKVLGVVTDGDVLRATARCAGSRSACQGAVRELMSTAVVTCRRKQPVDQVLSLMTERGLRRIPVVADDGTLEGVVTMRDALSCLYDEAKTEERLLIEYFLGVGYH